VGLCTEFFFNYHFSLFRVDGSVCGCTGAGVAGRSGECTDGVVGRVVDGCEEWGRKETREKKKLMRKTNKETKKRET